MTARYNTDLREAVCRLGDHTVIFRPKGKVVCHEKGGGRKSTAAEARKSFGKGGPSARIFMGLSVGEDATFTVDDVVQAVARIRRARSLTPNASILSQKGIYEDRQKRLIVEDSVQIVIIDVDGTPIEEFKEEVLDLADELIDEFEQEEIVVELQDAGIVQELFSVTADEES